ncbi:hypothetical protein D3C75_1221110 [compost metagenome]
MVRKAPPMSRLLWPSSLRQAICGNGFLPVVEVTGAAGPGSPAKLTQLLMISPRPITYFFMLTSPALLSTAK